MSAFKPDGVIFDFDGTLADSMWVWDVVDRKFLEKRCIPFSKEYAETIAVLGFESGADYVIDYFGLDEQPEDIIEEWKRTAQAGYANDVVLKPGARELLERLHDQGLPLAIATSLQRELLEPCLKNNGVFDLFDAICVCDELGCLGKSTSIVYEEAARHLHVPLERCVIFEDVASAAASAKKTGAYLIGVYDSHKQQKSDELKAVVDQFIYDFDEVSF